jgi:hypothetical protein
MTLQIWYPCSCDCNSHLIFHRGALISKNTIVKALNKTINAGELTNPYIGRANYTTAPIYSLGIKLEGGTRFNNGAYSWKTAQAECARRQQTLCPRCVHSLVSAFLFYHNAITDIVLHLAAPSSH